MSPIEKQYNDAKNQCVYLARQIEDLGKKLKDQQELATALEPSLPKPEKKVK
tara:strand:+ start:350 stop:505 length:156 start_codon:yes stop_codon:yes gene_type:complete